jgi:predicted transposase YbfD/YdcC
MLRGHWAIGDRQHWIRDVIYGEDCSQTRTASGPRVMATLRNLAISILRWQATPASPPLCATMPEDSVVPCKRS